MEDLIRANELPFSVNFVNKIKKNNAIVGVCYNLVICVPIIIIFCIIGAMGYVNSSDYNSYYGNKVSEMYSFADLMATWTSVMAFAFILFSIIGAMKNRKTNKVKVQKSKFFYPMAIISVITMSLPIFMTYFGPIADLFMLFRIPQDSSGYISDILVPRIMSVVVLILFLSLMIIPTLIEDYRLKYFYGSIDKGEIAKLRKMAKATRVTLQQILLESIKNQKRNFLNDEEKKVLGIDSINKHPISL